MAELVSILIPCCNAEQWVRETIESALYQTWPNKEIIIVDDGSADNSLQVAKLYESNIVKVISQVNKGGSAARNKALEYAQGNYIQWLDADDLLEPDKIEKQMKEIDRLGNSRILLSSSWAYFNYRHQKAKFAPSNLWRDLDPVEWFITKFSENVFMTNHSWLISRTLTELAGPWDERLARDQDGEYSCRVVAKSEAVKFVPEAKSYYRQGSPMRALSEDLLDKFRESRFLSASMCISYLRSLEDSERTRAACMIFLQEMLSQNYPKYIMLPTAANDLAKELGGKLSPAVLGWRFSIVKGLLGWRSAVRTRRLWMVLKLMIIGNWDKLLYRFSKK